MAPKTRPRKVESAVVGPSYTGAGSTAARRPSSSLDDLTTLTTPAQPPPPSGPLSGVTRQLIRDLERRQLELRLNGILAAGEVLDTGRIAQ